VKKCLQHLKFDRKTMKEEAVEDPSGGAAGGLALEPWYFD
jgi:hypothetical protein